MLEAILLLRIAVRNLFASFLNVIIGGIVLVGTFAFVVGSSLISNIDSAMSKSITGSVGGHLQVFSAKSKDDLALFNNWGYPDLAVIPDFSKVKTSLLTIPNVQAVVPMGLNGAFLPYGNSVDQALEKLRQAENKRLAGDRSPELAAKIAALKDHVQQMVRVIQTGYQKFAAISNDQVSDPRATEAIAKAGAPEFWASFDRDPLASLEFLENRISSLVPDADFAYLSYLGTDLDAFAKSFDRMQIVDGERVPTGHRGLLLSKYAYEEQFKLKIAHRLDKIHEALVDEGKRIDRDPNLRQLVKQNRNQTREIILQLDSISSKEMTERVQQFLHRQETDLSKLLTQLFDTDDTNFGERYTFFYKELAPLLELYRLKPGEMMTIKSFTKSGFVTSINLKVYGTFQFKGLEKSGLAGAISLMDLVSFRDLYGFLSPDKLAEMKAIQKESGAQILDRDRAEAELFGGTSSVSQAKEVKIDENARLAPPTKHHIDTDTAFTQEEIEKGVALNAALILKDPSKMYETLHEVEKVSERDGLDLKVFTWQKAAGNLGQFVMVAKLVLYIAVFIIFIVAVVIINNAVMMATLQRSREIGTMRAIGAQRPFVLSMVLTETSLLGVIFGAIGAFLGTVFIHYFGQHGIPANNEFLYFFFAGPRLYTTFGWSSLIWAFAIILVVTTFSALYPAVIATRVSPIQAMASED